MIQHISFKFFNCKRDIGISQILHVSGRGTEGEGAECFKIWRSCKTRKGESNLKNYKNRKIINVIGKNQTFVLCS